MSDALRFPEDKLKVARVVAKLKKRKAELAEEGPAAKAPKIAVAATEPGAGNGRAGSRKRGPAAEVTQGEQSTAKHLETFSLARAASQTASSPP